jgi:hypothetical protein
VYFLNSGANVGLYVKNTKLKAHFGRIKLRIYSQFLRLLRKDGFYQSKLIKEPFACQKKVQKITP